MKNFLKPCASFLEKLILPYHCVMCLELSDQRRDVCLKCQAELPASLHACLQCGIALSIQNNHDRCGPCIAHPPHFDDTIVGFNYQIPIDTWLKQFKFHKKGLYARILTEIYAEKINHVLKQRPENKPQMLVPMPLHWRRIAQRGFNQAYIIAQQLSKQTQIPIIQQSRITRIKYTQPQSSLDQHARQKNLLNAFHVQNLSNLEHVAIVDDIFTTGNTVNELSKQLKQQGIYRVSIWALARVN